MKTQTNRTILFEKVNKEKGYDTVSDTYAECKRESFG